MNTPTFQQLSGLLTYVRAQLRADEYLVTDSDGLEYDADQVLKATYDHKIFELQSDALAMHVDFGLANAPALGIYVTSAEYTSIRGSWGLDCALGIQYIFESQARDITNQAFASHFSMAVWWAICEAITEDISANASTLHGTYHIEEIGLGGMELLPPLTERLRAFQASGSMSFKRPMWNAGADSHQVVDLASVHTDYNETGDTGEDALVQSIYEP